MFNPFSLEGKTILITGASSGIGRATAVECAKLGAKCIITGRNADRLQETYDALEGSGHMQVIADLSAQEGIDLLADISPNVDGLVNNAGIGFVKPVVFVNQEDLEKVFQVNTFAPILLTKALLRKKKLNKQGSIVFMSSISAFGSNIGRSVYGASKSAIMAYMHYCARELASKPIRVNAVHPAMTDTPLIHSGSLTEEERLRDMEQYPLKRYAKPEEIAYAIIYLLSDASAWTTGTSLIVDGGLSLL